ncbi:MAG: glycine zipper family protein [Hydrogenothermus sp.]|nr:MAG: glycine zipper family protein [Hydrogenothermus sp.]
MKKIKSLILSSVLGISLLASSAKALDGEIIFRDTLYGAGVGALAGGAYYLIDSEDFGSKIGTGLLVGLIVGFGIGVYESQTALVEIENGKMHASLPEIKIQNVNLNHYKLDTISQVSLLGVKF